MNSSGRINSAADSFARALQNNEQPRIEDYLEGVEEGLRPHLLERLQEAKELFQETASPVQHPTLRTLDQYELIERLGSGGMGEVYRARHKLIQKEFAVKLLPRERVANPKAVSRFLREMRALGTMPQHENVVGVHHAGEWAGEYFLAMELIDGIDLDRLIHEQGPLPWAVACRYARQIAQGLKHLDEYGIVHRDIKPSNAMLAAGVVKITDLGLALLRTSYEEEDLTGDVVQIGTRAYKAPEQETNPHGVDGRADVYSLGCTLTTLLGGQLPNQLPVAGDIPAPLRDIVRRMTAPEPNERYASAADAILALDAVLTEHPVVIAVMGTKGGVGKGTLIAFIAQILADSGNDVAVVDFDLGSYGSTAHAEAWYARPCNTRTTKTVFEHFAPNAAHLNSKIQFNSEDLWDVTPTSLEAHGRAHIWMIPALVPDIHLDTFDVIANIPPIGRGGRTREEVVFGVTLEIIARTKARKPVRFVLIDCGAGVNPSYSAALAAADYRFVVTTPDPDFQKQIPRIKEQFARAYPRHARFSAVHAIVNMRISAMDEIGAQAIQPCGFIPYDPLLQLHSYSGKELTLTGDSADRLGHDPWDAIGIDYEQGYGEVQRAIHGMLRRVLREEHRGLVRDELEIRSGWTSVPAAAARYLASTRYRWSGWVTMTLAIALIITAVGAAVWGAVTDAGTGAWVSASAAVTASLAMFVWIYIRHRDGNVLRHVARWAAEPPLKIREHLTDFLPKLDPRTRRRLYELGNPLRG